MRKRLLLAFVFALTVMSSWAQGDNVGMGGRDEGVASILEKLDVMKKKNDAFNIFLNTSMAYEEHLGRHQESGFKGRQMRFEARGFLDEHWSYRFRYKLNNSWAVHLAARADAGDPELTEVSLLLLAPDVGIAAGLHHLLLSHLIVTGLVAPVTLRQAKHLVSVLAGHHCAFNSCHL